VSKRKPSRVTIEWLNCIAVVRFGGPMGRFRSDRRQMTGQSPSRASTGRARRSTVSQTLRCQGIYPVWSCSRDPVPRA
jgi:hypothetical protein